MGVGRGEPVEIGQEELQPAGDVVDVPWLGEERELVVQTGQEGEERWGKWRCL